MSFRTDRAFSRVKGSTGSGRYELVAHVRVPSDGGGSAVPVLYLHHGFLSFLADWAIRILEIIREVNDCGRPTPAASKPLSSDI